MTDKTPNPTVLALYKIIRSDVEEPDGSWPGGDVVDALTEWFTTHGINVDEPNPFRGPEWQEENYEFYSIQ